MIRLVLALVLIGCGGVHVATPPAVDAGPGDASSPSCLEWRQRANPEDVYCARWSDAP